MTIREAFKLYSVRLAAAAAAATGVLIDNQELLFTLLALIPTDPVFRAIVAVCAGGVVFLAPYAARMWPQPDVEAPDATGDE